MPKLVKHLENIIESQDFQARHKESPNDFTRKRSLPFKNLVTFFANLNKGSYETELKEFFKTKDNQLVPNPDATKSAVTKARKKLKPSVFVELNKEMINEYERTTFLKTWNGMRLIAVDGSTGTVPDEQEILEHFGVWNGTNGDPCPKARISQMFDVLNHLTLDALIRPKKKEKENWHLFISQN